MCHSLIINSEASVCQQHISIVAAAGGVQTISYPVSYPGTEDKSEGSKHDKCETKEEKF